MPFDSTYVLPGDDKEELDNISPDEEKLIRNFNLTFDQIRWIADRLGTLTLTNPTLMLARVRELGLDEELGERSAEAPVTRADHIRVLCPRCRRESLIATER